MKERKMKDTNETVKKMSLFKEWKNRKDRGMLIKQEKCKKRMKERKRKKEMKP